MMKVFYDVHLRRRALFVLGNVAICAVIVGGLAMPTRAFFVDRDSRISNQLKVLARLSAIAAQAASERGNRVRLLRPQA